MASTATPGYTIPFAAASRTTTGSAEIWVSFNSAAPATCTRANAVSYRGSPGTALTSSTPAFTPEYSNVTLAAPAGIVTVAGNLAFPFGADSAMGSAAVVGV